MKSTRVRIIIIAVILLLLLAEAFLLILGASKDAAKSDIAVDGGEASATEAGGTVADIESGSEAGASGSEADSEADFPESSHLTAGLYGTNPTLVKEGDPYIESGAFCIDDRTGIIKDYETAGSVNTSAPGTYDVTYSFTSEKARTDITRTVKVVPQSDFDSKTDGVAVFMYHYVYTEEDVPENLNGNYIMDAELEEQLAWLKENDFYFPSFAELRAFVDGKLSLPQKSCILTFDDGQKGFLKYGIPLLEKHQVPATSFLIVQKDANKIIKENASPYINFESHSFDMHRAGGTIGHGGIISALTKEEIAADLQKAIDILGSSQAFAYPYGDYTEEAAEAVAEVGILCAFTTEYEWVRIGNNPALLPRVRISGGAGLDAFIASI